VSGEPATGSPGTLRCSLLLVPPRVIRHGSYPDPASTLIPIMGVSAQLERGAKRLLRLPFPI